MSTKQQRSTSSKGQDVPTTMRKKMENVSCNWKALLKVSIAKV